MAEQVTLIFALIAGLVSFLSPCILPIIPGFLAYLGGNSVSSKNSRREVFLNSVFFVLGFSLIFSILGVLLNTVLESVAYDVQVWLSRIGGVVIILFGLYLTGILKIPFLEKEHKFAIKQKFNSRYVTSFIFGSAFAAGWTPCVGAVLGSILGLAASAPQLAFPLLLTYSLGLGIPFLLVGAFTAQASSLILKYQEKLIVVNKAFGVILVILGILVFTQTLNLIASFDLLNQVLLD